MSRNIMSGIFSQPFVANKLNLCTTDNGIGLLMDFNDHSVAVCRACCATDGKYFHITFHSPPFAFMETVANDAVRLSNDLRLI